MDETQQQVIDWLANGEIGVSSRCMAMWLAFGERMAGPFGPGHPHDPDDMDRCLKLLHRAPGLRSRLSSMADLSPGWAALVARWDEIEALQLEEIGLDWTKARSAPRTYALMREVLDGVRRQQRRIDMPISDYIVPNDHFEPDEQPHPMSPIFPCTVCRYRTRQHYEAPCSMCGHNLLAEMPKHQNQEHPT